jgi:3-dehydroquinate dehydratase-2
MKITLINGANLNLLGQREPHIYGNIRFDEYLVTLKQYFANVEFNYFQSNIEGEIVDAIQKAQLTSEGIILNAGGYSHTSVVVADAVKSVSIPCIEVHISNLFAREKIRHNSLIAAYAKGAIIGLGLDGYRLAVEYLVNLNKNF